MATQHTISIQQVHNTLAGARNRGMDTMPLLTQAGIAPILLDSPLARISQQQYAMLIRALRRALRDEMWGWLSHRVRPGTFGQCLRRVVNCATLEDALREAFAFYHLVLADFTPRLQAHGAEARMVIAPHRAGDACLEYAVRAFMLYTFTSASWLVGRRIPLLRVDYGDPQFNSETSRVYQVPVCFGTAHVGLAFEAQWLTLPVVQSRQNLGQFLAASPANLIVRYRDHSTVTEQIRRLLRKRLGGQLPVLEDASEALGLPPHVLRRRLRAEGRSFLQIKDELRRDAAIEFLLQTVLTLPEIADRVGFSDASTFHRAFKQWTGVAPGEYRSAHRATEL